MKIKNIYRNWCTEYTVTLDELLSEDKKIWSSRLLDRQLLVIKGLGNQLTGEEFSQVASKFGVIWTTDEYKGTYANENGKIVFKSYNDRTLQLEDNGRLISHFKVANNIFGANGMSYHADMAHIGEKSFPSRALYMTNTTQNNSGKTEWLNLEYAWEQFTDEEKAYYKDVYIYQHHMYARSGITKFPFLKTNPYTGQISPRVNCYRISRNIANEFSWVHHAEKDGKMLEWEELRHFIESVYRECESKNNTLYKHTWENGDILIYDNWASVHRRDPVISTANEKHRLLKRITLNIHAQN